MKSALWAFALVVIGGTAVGLHAAGPATTVARPSWEYFTVGGDDRERLTNETTNKLGRDGWELVAVTSNGKNDTYFFKRPR